MSAVLAVLCQQARRSQLNRRRQWQLYTLCHSSAVPFDAQADGLQALATAENLDGKLALQLIADGPAPIVYSVISRRSVRRTELAAACRGPHLNIRVLMALADSQRLRPVDYQALLPRLEAVGLARLVANRAVPRKTVRAAARRLVDLMPCTFDDDATLPAALSILPIRRSAAAVLIREGQSLALIRESVRMWRPTRREHQRILATIDDAVARLEADSAAVPESSAVSLTLTAIAALCWGERRPVVRKYRRRARRAVLAAARNAASAAFTAAGMDPDAGLAAVADLAAGPRAAAGLTAAFPGDLWKAPRVYGLLAGLAGGTVDVQEFVTAAHDDDDDALLETTWWFVTDADGAAAVYAAYPYPGDVDSLLSGLRHPKRALRAMLNVAAETDSSGLTLPLLVSRRLTADMLLDLPAVVLQECAGYLDDKQRGRLLALLEKVSRGVSVDSVVALENDSELSLRELVAASRLL